MDTTRVLQFLSYFSAFVPLIAAIAYWYKKGFSFNTRVNLIGVFILFYFVSQFTMLILALNGIHNLLVLRFFIVVEIFIFSYFLLSFQLNSKKLNLLLSFLLSLTIIVIDLIWGNSESLPVESLMVAAITITIMGMAAIPSIEITTDYESSLFYFTLAILISSVNTLLGVGFIELAPKLSLSIQSIVSITSNLVFASGFFIIIKSKLDNESNELQ